MDGQLFEIGQAITPVSDPEKWGTMGEVPQRPKFGDIYHVSFYHYHAGMWWIALKELPQHNVFLQEGFAPVMGDDVLAKLLESVAEEEEALV